MRLKQLVRSTIRRAGFDVRRFHPASSEDAQFAAMLAAHSVNMVLDVGANAGQFGSAIRGAGYRSRIVSFEPLSTARTQLAKAIGRDPLWTMAEKAALGAADGAVDLHISGNSVSSSILPMLERHASAEPSSRYVGVERVPLRTLDDLAAAHLNAGSVIFLKIDTQGYEDRVLQGSSNILRRAVGLRIELSFVPLYAGQLLYKEMLPRLEGLGFELWNIAPAFIDRHSGRLLQVDGTFFRS